MSRKLIEKNRRRLEAESGCRANPWGGRLTVALVYPNTYHQAMSNLGFQSVYQLLNSRHDTLCERFFLPDPDDLAEHRKTGYSLFSLESERLLTDFDLIAFSLSFENDYLNLPILFDLARIPFFAEERGENFPLTPRRRDLRLSQSRTAGGDHGSVRRRRGGGAPSRPAAGLGGRISRDPSCCGAWRNCRDSMSLPCTPSTTTTAARWRRSGRVDRAPARVARQWLADLDSSESRSFILTEATEFGDMALTEVSRGCSRGCRFCAAGFLYLPPRERSLDRLLPADRAGLCERGKIGLVGAAVFDHSAIGELSERHSGARGHGLRIEPAHRCLARRGSTGLAASGHRPSPSLLKPAASACAT